MLTHHTSVKFGLDCSRLDSRHTPRYKQASQKRDKGLMIQFRELIIPIRDITARQYLARQIEIRI